MADKKTQYPIRLDISQPGNVRTAPERSFAHQIGSTVGDAIKNVVLGNPVTGVVPLVRSIYGSAPVQSFTEGALGLAPGAMTAPAPAAAPKVAAKAPAAAAGVVPPANLQPIAITPQMRALAEIDSILSQPHTRKEARETMAMIPAPLKPATGKNRVAELGAQAAQDWFAGQVAAADKLKVSDPEGARSAVAQAQTEYLRWLATLAGGDPAQQALAGMYSPAEE